MDTSDIIVGGAMVTVFALWGGIAYLVGFAHGRRDAWRQYKNVHWKQYE